MIATGVRIARKLPWNAPAPAENGLACANASPAVSSSATVTLHTACLCIAPSAP